MHTTKNLFTVLGTKIGAGEGGGVCTGTCGGMPNIVTLFCARDGTWLSVEFARSNGTFPRLKVRRRELWPGHRLAVLQVQNIAPAFKSLGKPSRWLAALACVAKKPLRGFFGSLRERRDLN